jgi:hypothetical protein
MFINMRIIENKGILFEYDKSCKEADFDKKMHYLGMNNWRVFGKLVLFYKDPK